MVWALPTTTSTATTLGLVLLVASGCRSVDTRYPDDLNAPNPKLRIRAARLAGERRDPAAVPILVDRLEDPDEAVRFFSILALRRITGTDMGYAYHGSTDERSRAVERWRQYIQRSTAHNADGDPLSDRDDRP